MAYATIIDLIEDVFKKCGVPCLLCGGFAVNAHGYSRTTFDVDLMVPEDKYPDLCQEFQKQGFRESYRGNIHGRFSGHLQFLMDIDLLFTDAKTFQGLLAQATKKKIGARFFNVISLDHLIAMKLHAIKNNPENREFKDLHDIRELIRENRIDVRGQVFKNLFLKYGTEELYEKIITPQVKK